MLFKTSKNNVCYCKWHFFTRISAQARIGLSIALLSYTLVVSNQLVVFSRPLLRDEEGATACSINDPTGTATNIRSSPNGKIIGQVQSGRGVALISRGKKWSLILDESNGRMVRGYVVTKYLICG